MKNLPIKTHRYQHYIEHFGQWLWRMGMSASAQYNMPLHVIEFLHFMEHRQLIHIDMIGVQDIRHYFAYLRTRPNQRRSGGVSAAHYNKHLQAIKKFSSYLWNHYHLSLDVRLPQEVCSYKKPVVLTELEVAKLYEATEQSG